jgi:hypothetical protein
MGFPKKMRMALCRTSIPPPLPPLPGKLHAPRHGGRAGHGVARRELATGRCTRATKSTMNRIFLRAPHHHPDHPPATVPAGSAPGPAAAHLMRDLSKSAVREKTGVFPPRSWDWMVHGIARQVKPDGRPRSALEGHGVPEKMRMAPCRASMRLPFPALPGKLRAPAAAGVRERCRAWRARHRRCAAWNPIHDEPLMSGRYAAHHRPAPGRNAPPCTNGVPLADYLHSG